MAKEVNNFDVLKKMAQDNKGIALFPDVLSIDKDKKGCRVTIGAPFELLQWEISGKYKMFLMAYNISDFEQVKGELEKQD